MNDQVSENNAAVLRKMADECEKEVLANTARAKKMRAIANDLDPAGAVAATRSGGETRDRPDPGIPG